MARVLGLDVSTSVVGVCVLDDQVPIDDVGSYIVLLDRIEFKKCKTLWEKADTVSAYLDDLIRGSFESDDKKHLQGVFPKRVILEEPLMGFRPGMSSAQTITTLMRFNGIVSYLSRRTFKSDPEYLNAAHARKVCGVKLQKTKLGGPQKEQVFSHMSNKDLKHVVWPTKKSGQIVDWSRDATDAYVIARAACLEGTKD